MPERGQGLGLRGAVARGDGAAVVHLLGGGIGAGDCLQLVGDGLRIALRQHVDGAGELAGRCAVLLRQRGWEGDDELAALLEAALGEAPAPLLRPLAVDLEELALVLEGDPVQGGGRIDLVTGEVWPQAAVDYAIDVGEIDEDDDDPDRWLWVDRRGSRPGFRDRQWFIADLGDAQVADRLSRAISGRGAFRRFNDTLSAWPDLLARWYTFSQDRQRGRARAWLAGEGYAASPAHLREARRPAIAGTREGLGRGRERRWGGRFRGRWIRAWPGCPAPLPDQDGGGPGLWGGDSRLAPGLAAGDKVGQQPLPIQSSAAAVCIHWLTWRASRGDG